MYWFNYAHEQQTDNNMHEVPTQVVQLLQLLGSTIQVMPQSKCWAAGGRVTTVQSCRQLLACEACVQRYHNYY